MFTCVVATLNERCENGEDIQNVDSVVPLAVAVKINRLYGKPFYYLLRNVDILYRAYDI